ncbi:unnamed protein product, partial [Penicillium discolor]
RRRQQQHGTVRNREREVLRHHLAEHDVQERHDEQRDRERHDIHRAVRPAQRVQRHGEQMVDGGLGHVQDEQRADRDAELRGREHERRVLHGRAAVQGHLVADDRHPLEDAHDVAADRVVHIALRHLDACAAAQLVRTQLAGEGHPVAVADDAGPRPVVFVGHLADQLLHEVLQRHDPRRPAVLVHDDRELISATAEVGDQGVDVGGLRHAERVGREGPDGHLGPAFPRHRDGGLEVHDAGDVVEVLIEDREAAVAGAPRQLDHVVDRVARGDRVHARARRHDVGRGEPRERERAVQQRRGVGLQHSGARRPSHEGRELLRAAGAGELLLGLDAHAAQHPVGAAVEHDHRRLEHGREGDLERHDELRRGQGQRQREVLRDELAEDHREHRRDEHRHHGRDGSDGGFRDVPGDERGAQEVGQRRFHRVSGQQRGQRDAELRGGEMRRGVPQGADRQGEAGLASRLPRFQIRAVEVHEGELARDEKAGADREQKPHAQHDVVHQIFLSGERTGRWGDVRQLGGSSIRLALLVARRRLQSDESTVVELRHGRGPGVGEGRPHARRDHVEQVLDARAQRVEVDLGGGDALGEQLLARPLVGVEPTEPRLHRLGRGHPPRLLEQTTVRVALELARGLDRPGEPGADHDGGRTGREREGDVPRVAHPAVGPDVRSGLGGGLCGLQHRGELGTTDRRHHPRRAHRPWSDADLEDRGARVDEIPHAVRGDDVPRDDGEPEPEGRDLLQRPEHALLVAVRGVDDEHVDPGRRERLRFRPDVAVDADRRGDGEATVGVHGRPVQRGAEGAAGAQRPDEVAVVDDRDHLDVRLGDDVEGVPFGADVVRVDGRRAPVHEVAELRVGQRGRETGGREHPDDAVDGDRRRAGGHDDAVAGGGGEQAEGRPSAREHGGDPRPGHRVHVRGDERQRRRGAVVRSEIDLEATGDGRAARHQEDVRVGQIDGRLRT